MASIVPDAAVEFLLTTVKEFVDRNCELISGAKENFDKLQQDLNVLKGFLQEFSKKYDNSILENLAKNVRHLIYRAEDVIETFIVEAEKQRHRGKFRQWIHKGDYLLQVRNLAIEIEKISGDVQSFYTNQANIGIEAMKLQSHAGPDEETKDLKVIRPHLFF